MGENGRTVRNASPTHYQGLQIVFSENILDVPPKMSYLWANIHNKKG